MIKLQISGIFFIVYFVFASTIFAFDTPLPDSEEISPKPVDIKYFARNIFSENLPSTILPDKKPFSHEEKIHLTIAFFNDHVETIIGFFKDKLLMDYYEYLRIIKGIIVSEANKNTLGKEIKLQKLAAAFTQQEISDPLLKEMYHAKAAMTYSAALENTKANALLAKITNKRKNNEILYVQTMVYFASGNFEKCLEYGNVLKNKHSFCDEKAIPALVAFLKACYYLNKEELATTTVKEQVLPLIIKAYSLQELHYLYFFFVSLVPNCPIKPYILDDLRDLTITHFTSKLTETYQEAQYLFNHGNLEEAKCKFKESCRNPFATLNILSDYYILKILLGVKKPSASLLLNLNDKIIAKNYINFNEVIRTLKEEYPQVRQEKFIQELKRLNPEMQKVFLYQKEVNDKDKTFFEEYFQICLDLILEQLNSKANTRNETNSPVKTKLESGTSEKGRPKRKKKNRKNPRSSQHVMEKKTPSSLDSSLEILQDTTINNLAQQIAINEENREDKEAEKVNPTLPLDFPSPLSHSLLAEGEPAGLESLEFLLDQTKETPSPEIEQPPIADGQGKNETEETIMAHFMRVPKEELIDFIFELHSKAKKIQSNADRLTLVNATLSEENNRLKKENNQLQQNYIKNIEQLDS